MINTYGLATVDWKMPNNEIIKLIHENDFKLIPNGVKLKCINGSIVEKGKDYIDMDTRAGFIAFGFYEQ